MGFKPTTSTVPMQCSTNKAVNLTESWALCEFLMYSSFRGVATKVTFVKYINSQLTTDERMTK